MPLRGSKPRSSTSSGRVRRTKSPRAPSSLSADSPATSVAGEGEDAGTPENDGTAPASLNALPRSTRASTSWCRSNDSRVATSEKWEPSGSPWRPRPTRRPRGVAGARRGTSLVQKRGCTRIQSHMTPIGASSAVIGLSTTPGALREAPAPPTPSPRADEASDDRTLAVRCLHMLAANDKSGSIAYDLTIARRRSSASVRT
mmetsp:Transcript_18293/g.64790  ORF Transcript_18293/g.64790 Transcript_18293/m.64790 type:complete len:201 (-) Transcript_18293:1708-2310(-)